ncbi:MAG: translation initiation factor IF-2, partial [Gammaproteobacteria bacterium]|nr:translation initiation factor IF-2 [Gammaproteobacteria bacterium]
MAEVTVAQYADVLKVPVEKLLAQLDEAGIQIEDPNDTISEEAKMELLMHLRKAHGRKAESAGPSKITLKRKSQGELKLPSAQGRARTVNVEVRRKRTYIKRDVLEAQAREQQEELDERRREAEQARQSEEAAVEEKRLRQREQEAEESRKAEEEARKQAEEEARLKAEAAELKRQREEAERKREEAAARASREKKAREKKPTRYGRAELHVATDKSGRRRRKKTQTRRRSVNVNVETKHGFERPTAPVIREVAIPETITVAELAQKMAIKAPEVIKAMMKMGLMVTINQNIDQDTAAIVVEELGHKPVLSKEAEIEDVLLEGHQPEGEKQSRPPVVTVMGHVDHGKTSLLDHIRRSKVTAGEAGGITQHIGAYRVETPRGVITFLDTPGHEAFTAMRARGAKVTDIVILVVAADDGVMPQTIEAIKHARAAEVPLVVAINKIDKADADPDRVKNELISHEVIPDDLGGDSQFVPVSAQTGEGIDNLLESVLLQAEVMELGAVADGQAAGIVLESSLEKGRGAVATLLVSSGILRQGDVLLAGQEYGRVRAMFDEHGDAIKEAGPATPAVVLGLSGTPGAGDDFLALEDDKKAREVAELRQDRQRDADLAKQQ